MSQYTRAAMALNFDWTVFLPKGPAVSKTSLRSTIGKRPHQHLHCSSRDIRCPSRPLTLFCVTAWVGVKATTRLRPNSRTRLAPDPSFQEVVADMACRTLPSRPPLALGTISRRRPRIAGPGPVLQHGAVSVALEGRPTACREVTPKGSWSTWLLADSLHWAQ